MNDPRIDKLIDLIISYAQGNLEKRIDVIEEDDELNVVAKGLNMLGEELDYRSKELYAKQSETEKLLSELSSSYNNLMQFNYIVSHNLRAPVANIIGLCNLIHLPGISEEDKLQTISHINTAAQNIDNLIKDLSVLLAMRAPHNIKKVKVFLPSLVETISNNLEKQIAESKAIIKTNFRDDATEIFTIKSYLESIFYNLISNAIKFQSNNKCPEIIISSKKEKNIFLITVSDNGIGIDLEKYGDKIFGLYQRFNLEVEGKGLGLNMTKMQVEAVGGKIILESTPGNGTLFTITFPL